MGRDICIKIRYGIDISNYVKHENNKNYINNIEYNIDTNNNFNVEYIFCYNTGKNYIVSDNGGMKYSVIRYNDSLLDFCENFANNKNTLINSANNDELNRFCKFFNIKCDLNLIELLIDS